MSAAAPPKSRFAKAAPPQEELVQRNLKIKTGILKRNIKDLAFTKAEVERETLRLNKVTADDPEKISQQNNVIQEAKMMIPLAENRVRTSLQDLKDFLATEVSIPDGEAKTLATLAISDGEAVFESS